MNNKEILITGGTGSLGTALTMLIQKKYKPKGVRIFSRSELNQFNLANKLKKAGLEKGVAFLIGDIRDRKRLELACQNVDIIINCAAMKRIDTCDINPLECISTNVGGVQNVVYAALENNVEKVFQISTDKAVYPTTLYGSSKKCAEDLIKHANTYSGGRKPRFSCARYGNVLGSNGSVVQIFQEQAAKTGVLEYTPTLTITDQNMTRFWITLEKVAAFILSCLTMMQGEEIFIPKMPSMSIMGLAKAVCPEAEFKFIGIRGQEKVHECLLTEEESRYTIELNDRYCVTDSLHSLNTGVWKYLSNTNEWQLTRDELLKMLEEL